MAKTALLLSGAGARGACQVGYLKAVRDLGIDYETTYATSGGSLNGLLLYQDDLELLEHLWLTIKNKDVFNINYNPLSFFTGKAALYDSSPLRKLLEKHVNFDKIQQNPKTLYINVTDLITWQPLSFDVRDLTESGIVDVVLASGSIPPLFPSVKFREFQLVDGGLTNNYSIIQAMEDGFDTLISLSPSVFDPQPVNNLYEVLLATIGMPVYNYYDREVACLTNHNKLIDRANVDVEPDYRKIRLVQVRPPTAFGIKLLDFDNRIDRKELIKYSYEFAKRTLCQQLELP